MLIKAISHIAGPGLVATSGQVVDVDEEFAVRLIMGGYAVPVRQPNVETATIEPQEMAVEKRATKRAKK
jgi:hypothetical protein